MDILIAGRGKERLRRLQGSLRRLGHETYVARSGPEIVSVLKKRPGIRLVFVKSDIDVSGGMDTVRRIKSEDWGRYVYTLLVTRERMTGEGAAETDTMADDCLSRPFGAGELKGRVQAAVKIIELNEKLRDAHEIRQIYLRSGREVQENLIPVNFPDVRNLEIAARFIPSAFVSGDLYDIFRLDETRMGVYSIDVSGHGVAAALFSVGLSQRLTTHLQPGGLLKRPVKRPPFYRVYPPERVLEALDKEDMLGKYGRFFTMVYALVELPTRKVSFCRAGHNYPLLIRRDGRARYLDGGGLPLGLGIGAGKRERQNVGLEPGDSFILFSDGINETLSRRGGNGYGLTRVKDVLSRNHRNPLGDGFDALIEDAQTYQDKADFTDDISIIGFRWTGG